MNKGNLIKILAYAKINLTLEVINKRSDKYHEIISVLQTINLHDQLTIEPSESLSLKCDIPELDSTNNLAFKAAKLLQDHSNHRGGALITLVKKIPISAGLGGGSSDAAATLIGLNRLWNLGLSSQELMPLAKELGSDVPFFLTGGTAMVQGRGDQVRQLPPAKTSWFVILDPNFQSIDKTAASYSRLVKHQFTSGRLTRKLEARIRRNGDIPNQLLFNVFDEIYPNIFPDLEFYWEIFRQVGAMEIHMAGSGPALYAPVARREIGNAIRLLLINSHRIKAYLVSGCTPTEQ